MKVKLKTLSILSAITIAAVPVASMASRCDGSTVRVINKHDSDLTGTVDPYSGHFVYQTNTKKNSFSIEITEGATFEGEAESSTFTNGDAKVKIILTDKSNSENYVVLRSKFTTNNTSGKGTCKTNAEVLETSGNLKAKVNSETQDGESKGAAVASFKVYS